MAPTHNTENLLTTVTLLYNVLLLANSTNSLWAKTE